MKTAKRFALALALGLALTSVSSFAQTVSTTNKSPAATPPIVVGGKNSVPSSLQALVKKFETERGAYLTQEAALLAKLKNATTPAERAAIRKALQENREDFIAQQKQIREDVRQEITELKDKLNNVELDRLIQQVRQIESSHHHHGKT